MNVFSFRRLWLLALLGLATATMSTSVSQSQQANDSKEDAEPADAEQFTVPDGTPAELLAFIESLAEPEEPYDTRDEIRQVADAIAEAADRMLSSDEATDHELREAVEWRVGALSTMAQLGDRQASQNTDEVLERLIEDPRPVVANIARHVQLTRQVGRWYRLEAPEKQEFVDELVALFKSVELQPRHLGILFRLGDMVANTEDSEIISPAFDELLPLIEQADDPMISRQLPALEGIVRRVNLLGDKLELEGELLSGGNLDWESYRGKVVLVDFWATWCGPCRDEVPTVLEEYRRYKDEGFDVLGISLDDTREDAESYIDETGIPWKTVFSDDPEATGWNAPMATKYAISAIPRAILVDKQGKVVHMNARGNVLGEQLAMLLGEPGMEQTSSGESSDKKTAKNDETAVK